MKEKKTEKDLSILDNQDAETEAVEEEKVAVEAKEEDNLENSAEVQTDIEEEDESAEEKKKIQPWILITSIVLIVAIIAVGIFTWYNVSTLATYDGGRVTRAEFNEYFEKTKLAQGITDDVLNDPANAEDIQQFKDELLVSLAYDEIFYYQLEKLNVGRLTDEELAEIEESSRTMLDDYVQQNVEVIKAGLPEGYSDKDLENAIQDFETEALNQIGCLSFDDFVELRVDEEVFLKAYDELLPVDEVAPTDEEVQNEYDSLLAAQKEAYSDDPAAFLEERDNLEYSLFVPSGIRQVRHVLIKLEDETLSEIDALRGAGDEDEADKLYEEALAEIKPKAEEILAKLDAGEITFEDAVTEYGEDPGMEYYTEGYEICANYTRFVEEFTEGSMSLTTIGEYTGLVATSYGYHIIEYTSDVESEVVPFEELSQVLYDALLEANKSSRWLELINLWPQELNLDFKDETLNEMDLY